MLHHFTGPVLAAAASAEQEYTGFFSVDFWSLVFTWANLLILFLIIKHFLYKPVKKMLEARKNEVEQTYREADEAKEQALSMQKEYENHLRNSKRGSKRTDADRNAKGTARGVRSWRSPGKICGAA